MDVIPQISPLVPLTLQTQIKREPVQKRKVPVKRQGKAKKRKGEGKKKAAGKSKTKLLEVPGSKHTCAQCNKTFGDSSSLRKHVKIHGEKTFVCQVDGCGKRFIDNSKLKRHQLVHTGERPYACPYPNCRKRFSLDFNLKSHLRIHTGEKPFICKFEGCGKKFTQVSNLKAHKKTHMKKKDKIKTEGDAPGLPSSGPLGPGLPLPPGVHVGVQGVLPALAAFGVANSHNTLDPSNLVPLALSAAANANALSQMTMPHSNTLSTTAFTAPSDHTQPLLSPSLPPPLPPLPSLASLTSGMPLALPFMFPPSLSVPPLAH